MFSLLPSVAGFIVLIAILAAVVTSMWRRVTPEEPAARMCRATLIWRWSGALGGAIAAVAVASIDSLGGSLPLAAPVFCLGLLLGVIGGELAVRSPHTEVRSASCGSGVRWTICPAG